MHNHWFFVCQKKIFLQSKYLYNKVTHIRISMLFDSTFFYHKIFNSLIGSMFNERVSECNLVLVVILHTYILHTYYTYILHATHMVHSYIYMHACIFTYTHTHTHKYIHRHIHAHTIHTSTVHTYIHSYIHAHIQTYMHASTHHAHITHT